MNTPANLHWSPPSVSVRIIVSPRYNGNPDNGPIGFIGKLARIGGPCPAGIVGSPLGRGTDRDSAIADLRRRVGYESHVTLTIESIDEHA